MDPTITVDPRNPVSYVPVTFRNTATDANNTYNLNLGAAFLQDQIEITRYLQLIAGLRFDHFDLQSRDRRTNVVLGRVDDLLSPRVKITGWGWYYLSTVLDDFSRYIVAWRLGPTMCASDVTATLDQALTASGLGHINVKQRQEACARWSASVA